MRINVIWNQTFSVEADNDSPETKISVANSIRQGHELSITDSMEFVHDFHQIPSDVAENVMKTIIDRVAENEKNEEDTILKLINMGFPGEVLVDYFGFNMISVGKVEENIFEKNKDSSIKCSNDAKFEVKKGKLEFKAGITEITMEDLHYIGKYRDQVTNHICRDWRTDGKVENYAVETVIPDSVAKIGERAFWNCPSLESVAIPDSVTSIDAWAFGGCIALKSVAIPNSVTEIEKGVFYFCKSLESVVIPDSVTSIGEKAFDGCSALKSVTIPDSVTSIGDDSFRSCKSLETIVIPDGINSINNCVFVDCDYLKSVVIPDSVTSIGNKAFFNCKALKSIDIPNNVTSIGKNAFYGCQALKSITIPASVTSISNDAFKSCPNLTIKCEKGSYAEKYAEENGLKYNCIIR